MLQAMVCLVIGISQPLAGSPDPIVTARARPVALAAPDTSGPFRAATLSSTTPGPGPGVLLAAAVGVGLTRRRTGRG